jgi:hypothetical protein
MSEPKNHHYVSRCHINNFFNSTTNQICLYDKVLDNFYTSTSSKSIFSELFANSRFSDGKIDNTSLETELQLNFENHFTHITNLIENFEENIETNNFETIMAMYRLTLYGLVGEIRNPNYKRKSDNTFKSIFNEILENADDSLLASYQNFIRELEQTKYSNSIGYFDLALGHLEKMGDLHFKVFLIKSSDRFLLPDTSSIYFRAKINEYFNPDIREKAIVGVPLTDKIFILAESSKLPNSASQIIKIKSDNSEVVRRINKDIYNQAYKTVATSDQAQLTQIIADIQGSA